jgi:hypothetical protein
MDMSFGCDPVAAFPHFSATGACYGPRMNYELFMGEALAEARNGIACG